MNTQRVYNAAIDMVDRNVAEGRGAKTAFIDPSRRITYGELAEGCVRVAAMLEKLGLGREDRIAMMMLDTVDFPVLFWGAIRAGIVPIPINTLLTAEQYAVVRAPGPVLLSGSAGSGKTTIAVHRLAAALGTACGAKADQQRKPD